MDADGRRCSRLRWPVGIRRELPRKSTKVVAAAAVGEGQAEQGVAGRKWYSIADAAAYLGISQPTIFRWMRENLISFYKVGGSTRFSQQNLDDVIEKTTGRKEAEAVAGRCAACGHAVLIEGRVQGTGRLYFRPDKTRFWTFEEAMVPIRAKTCPACGYIQMHAETSKLDSLRPEEDKTASPAASDSSQDPSPPPPARPSSG